jgi:NADH-quinone oxidoreductase subunit L
MGKSAQVPLHTWLPDAMEGPTPVSALFHAATMVTAGVFMVCRLSPVFEYAPDALMLVTFIGASTAIFAATIGLCQTDIKRVIAYSTCSQLGYMFIACGVSAYGAAMFHLFTHAFFKALLFLGAGSVIHGVGGEQDMRKMGGLRKALPITYVVMWIGSLALAGIGIPGVYGFAGFYSKDVLLEAAWSDHTSIGFYAFWLGIIAASLTGFYSWRVLLMTFHGRPRASKEVMAHAHESPPSMIVPLIGLSIGAVVAGIACYGWFVGEDSLAAFWRGSIFVLPENDTVAAAHHAPEWVGLLPLVVGLIGIFAAWIMYAVRPDLPGRLARSLRGVYLFLLNKWYFDELYDWLIVRPANLLGYGLWKVGDGAVIDGLGPDGLAAASRGLARRAGRFQSGYVYHYAFVMVIGIVVLVSWYILAGHR